MAAATITIFPYPRGIDNTQRFTVVRGTISVPTGLYSPGGYSLSWASLSNVNSELIEAIPVGSASTVQPFDVDIKSAGDNIGAGGAGPSGFIYLWDSVTGNFHIFVSNNGVSAVSGPLVELGGLVPGGVVNDTIQFTAYFVRG